MGSVPDMAEAVAGCVICRGSEGDPELERVRVWEDRLWRLSTTLNGEVLGFSYLEPKRHIPYITDLDGEEARTLGDVLARTSSAIRTATGAELVYVYVFGGGIPHLHIHLVPHRSGDALNDSFIRGEQTRVKLPSGATRIVSHDFPPLPVSQHEWVRERIRQELAKSSGKS